MARRKKQNSNHKPQEEDYSAWETFTKEDLELLENLAEFLEEQKRKEAERIAFHCQIWDAALDATNNPIFMRDEPEQKKEGTS